MDKYIKVSDLKSVNLNHEITRVRTSVNNLIAGSARMVPTEEIEKLIKEAHTDISDHSLCNLIMGLRDLIKPQLEKFGRLTIPEWEQLNRLAYIKVELRHDIGSREEWFLNDIFSKEISLTKIDRLLPDPEGFFRAWKVGKTGLPDNVEVEYQYEYGEPVGFRIIGVKDE